MWLNEMILVLVAIFLATWGAIYLRKKGRKDFTLGFAILITSLIILFSGVTKILEEVVSVQDQYLNAFSYICSFFFWILAFIAGRSHWGKRLNQGTIQILVITPLIFWLKTRGEVYTWQDTFLYLSFTFLTSVITFRRNNSIFI